MQIDWPITRIGKFRFWWTNAPMWGGSRKFIAFDRLKCGREGGTAWAKWRLKIGMASFYREC